MSPIAKELIYLNSKFTKIIGILAHSIFLILIQE